MELSVPAFLDELSKIAAIMGIEQSRSRRRLDYFFSPKTGRERWDKFDKFVQSPVFVDMLSRHPGADDKLLQYASMLHLLAKSKPVGKVESEQGSGKTYEIRNLPTGDLACTCNDWKFVGTKTPGYACKHILAYRAGRGRV